jgi:hypothetical protein
MKKLILLALMAISFVAIQSPKADNPMPICDPCGSQETVAV